MAAIITLEMRLSGVTFTELKDNPSIRSEFITAVKGGILQASSLNNTQEIDLMLSPGSIKIVATITPPAGMEHQYSFLTRRGITEVATLVTEKVSAVPNIDSVGTGNIGVTVTQVPVMTTLPISSFNEDFGQEAEEREYTNLGIGQCRLVNEQMKIPASFVFSDASNDCRQLCNERTSCFGFTSNAIIEDTVDKNTGMAGHDATEGTGPCYLWMQRELGTDGYDENEGSCYVKKAICADDLICPAGNNCGQCKATNDGVNKPTDADDVPKRTCAGDTCDPDIDSGVCCSNIGLEDETDGAFGMMTSPIVLLCVVAAVGLFGNVA
jgi:hypothetical protein